MKRILSNRNFLKLWIGQIVSNMGDEVAFMGLAALIVYQWKENATAVSLLFIFSSLPVLIFGPIAGVFVDRWRRKHTMIWADLIRAVIVALLIFPINIWYVYALIFSLSTVSRFFYPARNAMIPNIVKEEKLVEANSLSQMTYMLAVVVGPALGAGLVALIGYTATFIFDAFTYLFSAITIFLIKYREEIKSAVKHPFEEMIDGFRYMGKNRVVLLIVAVFGIIMLVVGGMNVVYTLYIRDVLHMNIVGLGVLETLFGIGAVIGSFGVGLLAGKMRNVHLIGLGIVLIGISIIAMGLFPIFIIAVIMAFGIGFTNSMLSSPINAILQKAVKDEYRGKVFGAQGAVIQGAALISMGMMGFLISAFGIVNILLFMGSFLSITGIIILMSKKAGKLMDIVD